MLLNNWFFIIIFKSGHPSWRYLTLFKNVAAILQCRHTLRFFIFKKIIFLQHIISHCYDYRPDGLYYEKLLLVIKRCSMLYGNYIRHGYSLCIQVHKIIQHMNNNYNITIISSFINGNLVNLSWNCSTPRPSPRKQYTGNMFFRKKIYQGIIHRFW